MPGDAAELIYASWSKSNAQLMVLDHQLRIVLWSRGMVEAAFGLEPDIGTSLKALSFPSSEHRARAVASLEGVMGQACTILHPDRALLAATHAKPNVILHLKRERSFHVGLGATTDVVLCMSAAKIVASSVRAGSGGEVIPEGGAPYHVLVMGK